MKEFYLRFLSSLFLGPVFLLAIFTEGYFLLAIVIIIAFILSWEWQNLTLNPKSLKIPRIPLLITQAVLASVGAVMLVMTSTPLGIFSNLEVLSFAILIGGSALLYLLKFPVAVVWGTLYVGIFIQSFILIIMTTSTLFVFRLITLVWACDIGGYYFGRFGGPKLIPSVSPNKTWLGLAGSFVSAFGLSVLFQALVPWYESGWSITPYWSELYIFSVVVLSTLGDLFISILKRKAGVKDTSRIIPGHGGLLDRFDSFIAVVIFTAFMQIWERILAFYV